MRPRALAASVGDYQSWCNHESLCSGGAWKSVVTTSRARPRGAATGGCVPVFALFIVVGCGALAARATSWCPPHHYQHLGREYPECLRQQWPASTADGADTNPINIASAAAFLQSESLLLVNERRRSYTSARVQRTLGNNKNAALKLMWFALTHGWALPPSAHEFGLYLTKLSLNHGNSGALEQARNALKLICSLNGIDGAFYETLCACWHPWKNYGANIDTLPKSQLR